MSLNEHDESPDNNRHFPLPDIEGNWKMAHYYAAHFFADPMVSSIEENGDLMVYTVTDHTNDLNDLTLVIRLWRWSSRLGTPAFTWTSATTVVRQLFVPTLFYFNLPSPVLHRM